tara:strand:+ start:64 stop:318 length:255 start_codon:yes stop_codon:yes gene_type:complete
MKTKEKLPYKAIYISKEGNCKTRYFQTKKEALEAHISIAYDNKTYSVYQHGNLVLWVENSERVLSKIEKDEHKKMMKEFSFLPM